MVSFFRVRVLRPVVISWRQCDGPILLWLVRRPARYNWSVVILCELMGAITRHRRDSLRISSWAGPWVGSLARHIDPPPPQPRGGRLRRPGQHISDKKASQGFLICVQSTALSFISGTAWISTTFWILPALFCSRFRGYESQPVFREKNGKYEMVPTLKNKITKQSIYIAGVLYFLWLFQKSTQPQQKVLKKVD